MISLKVSNRYLNGEGPQYICTEHKITLQQYTIQDISTINF